MANAAQQEPTMEEILASIRRIISEDSAEPAKDAAPKAQVEPEPEPEPEIEEDDVLELTQVVNDPTPPVQVRAAAPEPIAQPAEPPMAAVREEPVRAAKAAEVSVVRHAPAERQTMLVEKEDEGQSALVSSSASSKAVSAFGALAQNLKIANIDSRTLEDVVHDLLKPMLKDWLERNLPDTVERLVQEEIDRMAKRGRR